MSTSIRREWAIWLIHRLQLPSVAVGRILPPAPLTLNSLQVDTSKKNLTPLIDSIGLGDMKNIPPIGSIQPPGTAITIMPFQDIIRPSDLAVISISFQNLKLEYSPAGSPTPSRLVVSEPTHPCYIQIRLPPQSIGEERFSDTSSELPIPTRARAAGTSNLIFQVPSTKPIPLSLHGILGALRSGQLETRNELTYPLP